LFPRQLNYRTLSAASCQEPLFRSGIGPAADARALAALISNQMWNQGILIMLGWVVTFLIIALIAGILGFGGVAGASIEIAKIIFFIAVVLFLVSAVVGLARGRIRP
jgi:uncharacterized membrane protein YtjA (UPF0391 family)